MHSTLTRFCRAAVALAMGALLALPSAAPAGAAPQGPPPRPTAPPSPDPSLTAHPLTAAASPVDNPLKGFARFYSPGANQNSGYPHSLTWTYFGLSEIMTNAANCGSYDWSLVDAALNESATYGNQVAMRFYMEYPGGSGTHPANAIPHCFDGHVTYRTNANWGTTSPDYDSAYLLTALQNFIAAFGARYDGDPRVGFVHTGLIGLWGEWHTWPYDTDTADGLPNYMPTDAHGAQILQAFDNAFNTTKLEVRYPGAGGSAASGFDIGYHDDSFCFREGSPLAGVTLPTSLGGASYSQLQRALDAGVENKWITSSMGGEVRPEIQSRAFSFWPGGSGDVDDMKACIELEHTTWKMNEQSAGYSSTDANVAAAVRLMGYDLGVTDSYYTGTASGTAKVGVRIANNGVAPFYYPWTVSLGLKNSAGTVVKSWDTSWDLRKVMPLRIRSFPDWNVGADPTYLDYGHPQYYDTSVSLSGVANGDYQWVMRVKNPLEAVNAGAKKLRFANAAQNADGWLGLGPVTVGTSTDTVAPSAPTGLAASATTSGSTALTWNAATDNVGVTSYQVLRNGTAVGTTATTSYTDTGLSAGTAYSYTVKARDAAGNSSAASSALSVTTQAAGTPSATVEAEASGNTRTGTAVIAACATCSGGSKVGYVGNGATLTFHQVGDGTAGTHTLTISYLSAEARTATVQVNGGAATSVGFPATADWNTVGTKTVDVILTSGNNTITLANASGWAPDFDKISVGGTTTTSATVEAEATGNTRTGTAVIAACATCSGGSKVGYVGNGATLTFNNVAGGTGGTRTLTISYLTAEARTATVQVNGGPATSVGFPATADWNTVGTKTVTVTLAAGANTITLADPGGWAPDVDKITVTG
ncbi:carbohydrate binding protein with CBM6 domain [Actinocorallia herbida]|uniref:Carbohydrate binding protein with CBM6 domain n=1 Tax=Actinocorallia herbida TaxID=58109 RepID=A0A3N1D0D2_9ACTN|nr:carbohydrate-binding protein [Actinocorallia herbida]ROO86974.1 carbohydrate binding protein with CBM6 domain [Actinocorallia herbida]